MRSTFLGCKWDNNHCAIMIINGKGYRILKGVKIIMILVVLSIIFIAWVIFASFAGAEPEIKVFGLTFFISFILLGPLFGGMLSIHAPVPMDPENTIDVLSIIISLAVSGIALGIYKIIDNIRYNAREREHERKLDERRRIERELEQQRELDREQRRAEQKRIREERLMELRRKLEEDSKKDTNSIKGNE